MGIADVGEVLFRVFYDHRADARHRVLPTVTLLITETEGDPSEFFSDAGAAADECVGDDKRSCVRSLRRGRCTGGYQSSRSRG